jgi:transposase
MDAQGGAATARPLLDDELWSVMEPLPPPPPKPRRFKYPGRKPLDRRKVLTGILFVLKTGIPWEDLPQEMGCGSGMSCWRHVRYWPAIHSDMLGRCRWLDRHAMSISASLQPVTGPGGWRGAAGAS